MSRRRGRSFAIVLVALASAALLVLGACGGGDKTDDGGTKTSSPAATGTSGGSTGGGAGGEAVDVKASEFKFESSSTSFTIGKAYELKATNGGTIEHNVYVFPKGERTESKAIAVIPTDKLSAGKSASTSLKFDAAGDYEFVCTVPGHEQAGMKLDVKAVA